jgi:hypothetical protein
VEDCESELYIKIGRYQTHEMDVALDLVLKVLLHLFSQSVDSLIIYLQDDQLQLNGGQEDGVCNQDYGSHVVCTCT